MMEFGRLLAAVATPAILLAFGVLLLRRTEGIKAEVIKQSEFHRKWAEQFFDCCHELLKALEREFSILTALSNFNDPNNELGTALQREASLLHVNIMELELRIRRSVVFAPSTGGDVTKASHEMMELTRTLVNAKKGNLDPIICAMNDFNNAARKAHAEMLGVRS